MSKAWMPLYVGDFIADTTHLNATETGIYMRLIMHCWQHGSIPKDDQKLARIAHADPRVWHKYKETVLQFFYPVNDVSMQHKRVDKELHRAEEISNKRKAAAKQKQSKSSAIAQQLDTQSQSPSPKNYIAPDGASTGKVYAFESGVIRLNQRDFELWKACYSHLDVGAELLAMTEWASQQRSWFNAVKGALAKKNQTAKERQQTAASGGQKWLDGIEGVL